MTKARQVANLANQDRQLGKELATHINILLELVYKMGSLSGMPENPFTDVDDQTKRYYCNE